MHIYTVKSFVEIVQYILKIPGAKFFLSERISQDPLEKFFGIQRQRGRTGDNPTVSQFCKNTQAIRLINSVCAKVKGNCRGREQSIVMEDNNLLPKRHRVRQSSKSNAENKDPLLHNRPTPAQKVDSLSVLTPAVHVVHKVTAPAVPASVKPVAVSLSDCSNVSISVPIPKPQPVLSPILLLDQSGVDQPAAPSSPQSISFQVSSECGKAEDVISKHQGIVLRRQDLRTLDNHRWLNDQVSFTQEL